MGIAVGGCHAQQIYLVRAGEHQPQSERIVEIVADVGIEDDLLRRSCGTLREGHAVSRQKQGRQNDDGNATFHETESKSLD